MYLILFCVTLIFRYWRMKTMLKHYSDEEKLEQNSGRLMLNMARVFIRSRKSSTKDYLDQGLKLNPSKPIGWYWFGNGCCHCSIAFSGVRGTKLIKLLFGHSRHGLIWIHNLVCLKQNKLLCSKKKLSILGHHLFAAIYVAFHRHKNVLKSFSNTIFELIEFI